MRLGVRVCLVEVALLTFAGCIPAHDEMPHVTATATIQVGEPTDDGFELLSIAKNGTTTIRSESGKLF